MLHDASRHTLQTAQCLIAKVAIATVVLSSTFTGFTSAEGAQSQNLGSANPSTPFSDIAGSYAGNEIEALAKAGIVSGYEEGRFFPEQPITRAELAKILVLATGRTESSNLTAAFKDVAPDSWYRGYVGALVEAGITEGTSAAAFSPDAYVTREELVVLFIRAMGLSEKAGKLPADAPLSDLPQVSDWAKASVSLAYQLGFISGVDNGDGTLRFAPKENAERQALALLAYSCWTRKAEFAAKADLLLAAVQTPAPSPSPSSAAGSKGGSVNGQNFYVTKATAINRTSVLVTLDKKISDPAYVKEFTFLEGLQVTEQSAKTGTTTVVLTTAPQTPGTSYSLYYDGSNMFQKVIAAPDTLEALNQSTAGTYKVIRAETVYGPQSGQITITGNLYIDAPGITLRNVRITGDLILTRAAGNGVTYLEGVRVGGTTSTQGGGNHVVTLTDTVLSKLVTDNPEGTTRIVAKKGGWVEDSILHYSSILEADLYDTTHQSGFRHVTISKDAPVQSYFSLVGNFETVDVDPSQKLVLVTKGSIGTLNGTSSSTFPPQPEAPALLASAVLGNGKIALQFSESPGDLTMDDFHIDAVLGGKPYSTGKWTYDAASKTIRFPEISAQSEELLAVGIRAADSRFAGHLQQLTLSGFSGQVVNPAGQPVEGVRLFFQTASTGDIAGEAVTDNSGKYSIHLPAGSYTGELTKTGYQTSKMTATSSADRFNRYEHAVVSTTIKDSDIRIVLSWGLNPRDVDAHLIAPSISGDNVHIWHGNPVERVSEGDLGTNLDADQVASYGPETITVQPSIAGNYLFYVHQSSGTGTLRDSSALVKVYRGANKDPEQTYHVPLGSGNEPYWTVFKMAVKEGSISFNAINQLTSSNPLQTASQLGNITALKSSAFKVYDGPRWIGDVPRGTTVEAFKQNVLPVDSGAHYELYAGDSSAVRTGTVENFDMLVVTAANGITKQTYTVRTLDNVAVDPAIGAVHLYASPDNTVTGAVYSQPIGTGTNTEASPFHIPASAKYLLIQFNQELAASQDGLKVYANGSLVSADSIRLLPDRILSLNLNNLPSGQAGVINVTGLKGAKAITIHPFFVNILLE